MGCAHSLIDVLCFYNNKLGVPDSAASDEAEGRGFNAAGGGNRNFIRIGQKS